MMVLNVEMVLKAVITILLMDSLKMAGPMWLEPAIRKCVLNLHKLPFAFSVDVKLGVYSFSPSLY